ncbi:MAG: T9SS type A sorting domain-containing protein [Chitinophagales bacterium]
MKLVRLEPTVLMEINALIALQATQVLPDQLNVFPPNATKYIALTTCNPSQVGVTIDTFLSVTGSCDSIVTTTVSLLPSDNVTIQAASCNPADTGISVIVLTNQYGCDSTVTTYTSLLDAYDIQLSAQTCDPANVGVDVQQLTASTGCDSTVTTTTTLLPSDEVTVQAASCNPADTGISVIVLTNQFGCDSTVTTYTSLLDAYDIQLSAQTCDPANVGVDVQQLTASTGCDSTVTTTTTLLPSDEVTLQAASCNPADTGISVIVLTNQFGCDSTVTTTTTLLPSDEVTVQAASCNPADTGISVVVLTNQYGCDSTVTTYTSLLESYSETIELTTSNPNEVGIEIDSFIASNGCDSIITIITTLIGDPCDLELPDTVTLQCDPISQTAEYCLPISFIDFINNYELVINDDLYIELPGACDFDTIGGYDFSTAIGATTPTYGGDPHILLEWFINGVDVVNPNFTYSTFEELAAYMQNLNPNGQWAVEDGDRITGGFPNSSANYGALNIFSPQIGALASIVYNSGITSNGTLIQDISAGCQWFYLTNVNEPNCGTDSVFVCVECCEPSNVTVYATSCDPNQVGTSIDSLTNEGGCDSVVTTFTTLLESYVTTLTPGVCDESLTEVSIDTLTANNGCDSIVITAPVLLPSYQQEFTETTCDPQFVGVTIDTLKTVDGCDSVITTITTLLESYEVIVDKESCLASDTGTVSEILTASNGCDSIVTTITSLVDGYSDTVFLYTCNPMPFDPIVVHFTSSTGCDSTITTIIVLEEDCNIICEDPENLYATDITFTQATLGWDAVPNGYSYTVQGRLKYNLFGATVTRVVHTNSFRTNHLFPFLTYEFRVQADCLEDEYIEWSHWSDWKSFTLNPFLYRNGNSSSRNANELEVVDLFDVEGILTSYPNPSRGDVNIRFNVDEMLDANIVITDISGREMDRIPVILSANDKPLISFDSYDNGLYFISFYKDGVKLATEKILLSK